MKLIADDGRFIVFDTVIDENHNDSALVSQHPQEGRQAAVDNRQRNPLKLTIRAVVSESLFTDPHNQDAANADDVLLQFGNKPTDRPQLARTFIQETQARPYTYQSTKYGLIPNLILESSTHLVTNAGQAVFKLQFVQAIFATSQRVEIPRVVRPRKAKPGADAGKQSKKDGSAAVNRSQLAAIRDATK